MKVAVIGAGVAGLCSARFLAENFPEAQINVFEATEEVGGTWRYVEDPKDDEYGLPPMTAMYKNLRTNLPKQLMGFSGFPVPDHFRSFMKHEEFLGYIRSYADHFGLMQYIKFRHEVVNVYPQKNKWNVRYRDLREGKKYKEYFDYVFVCNGQNTKFVIPEIEGQDLFKGTQIHSYKYRKPEDYKRKNVLVIGSGPSGLDIVADLSSSANKVFFSHHSSLKCQFPDNVTAKPDVGKFTDDFVVFQDGSIEKIDAVIYCTGYAYDFKFLDDRSGIHVAAGKLVYPLYQHVVNINNPTMFFIGIPQEVSHILVSDIQARYVLALMKGKFNLPSKEEMLRKTTDYYENRNKQQIKKPISHILSTDEKNYYKEITDESGIESYPNVIAKIRCEANVLNSGSVLTYRDCNFTILDSENYKTTHCATD